MDSALLCTHSLRQSVRLWWKIGEQYSSTGLITVRQKFTISLKLKLNQKNTNADVLAGKVILKMEKINVQVTLKDPSFETITEILRSHVSFTSLNFLCSKVVFHYIRLNLSRVNFHNTFQYHRASNSYNKAGILLQFLQSIFDFTRASVLKRCEVRSLLLRKLISKGKGVRKTSVR